ncbi:glycerol transport system ATP-binding protein [Cupriavidus gilardii CR3]|uniref:ABC transporter ATP-binding protein n=1 Tax=Cupriavidus gilardii TaxID=82541 RepID=A0A849BD35_9BURK|nr:ABC transporter ATP-binding protein [Cupriavidus gilardii]ALD91006.1 glycerol transport system ATP-binding protein [Cupriavidus gilardii CR3]KAB0596283.1 ABC transporter ATP-binding protein [Cupriavidus gilardii]MCT9012177.1 ABC transporter ATP-binding protein [Cupriavidus gilardii]MCT9053686.1 ABC transporter ATP-binding protein [Cupriavidus gilardii]NNH11753.1 ABC transporter ATP-binding protein [Cupriavidus gilardii]
MARIDLDLAHAYGPDPRSDEDYALLPLRFTFDDGGAYALLGPSGCGKTTLLNCISGLLRPSQGTVSFDGRDVTGDSPQARNIAQVFQFPVIYDTMTVGQNLAFPLRNRGVPQAQVRARVGQVAEMLDLSAVLDRQASGLAADAKQKISLGRGLVRHDVAAILFDEPLTVIDPHLKWQLRRKLKQIHREFHLTLIYVTHDQTEALTFADQVVVMSRGKAVQVGTADALFERPAHTFVGHFIGSPGMNFLPARWRDGWIELAGRRYAPPSDAAIAQRLQAAGTFKIGVRPEYLRLARSDDEQAVPAVIERAQDIGTYWIAAARLQDSGAGGASIDSPVGAPLLRARLGDEAAALRSGDTAWFSVFHRHTCYYVDEELVR